MTPHLNTERADCGQAAPTPSVLHYLRAVVAASQCLVAESDLPRAVDAALTAMRHHTGLDRIYVFCDVPGGDAMRLYSESHAPTVSSVLSVVGDQLMHNERFGMVNQKARAFDVYQSNQSEQQVASANLADDAMARSALTVPIVVEGIFWGVIGFDDCQRGRHWSGAEIAALEGSASAISAAVHREAAISARVSQAAAVAMRDRLLAAVSQSLQALFGTDDLSFEDGVRTTLGALGEACGIQRVKVIMQRPSPESGELTHFLDYEWWAPGMVSQSSLGLTRFPNSLIPEWTSVLSLGRALWYLIEDVPINVREAFESVGVRSVGAVPIFGAGEYLGLIAFDDCVDRRIWSDAEIDALTAAARAIGNAIHRHQLQRAMIEERERRFELKRQRADDAETAIAQLRHRDALLDAVARMSRDLLQSGGWERALQPGLRRLGEAAGIQRVVVLRQSVGSLEQAEHRVVLEWCARGVSTHKDLGLVAIPNDAAPAFTARLQSGMAVWSHVDDLADSVRDSFVRLGIHSTGCVPIIVADVYWGAITFDDCSQARDWDAAEIDSLSAAANAVAAAIGRQQAEESRLANERRRADALREANNELIGSMSRLVALTDLPEFMGQLLLALTRTCGARVGSLLSFDAVDGRLWMRQCVIDRELVDVSTDSRLALWRQPVPDAAVRAWRENLAGRVLAYHPVPMSPEGEVWPENLQWHWDMGHRQRLHFPLNIGGQLVGVAGLMLGAQEGPEEFQLQQAVVLAQQAAIAMQMERLAVLVETSAVRTERERMAADIHDSLAQSFTSIAMQSESLAGTLAGDQDKSRVVKLIERTAREGLAEARRSVLALMPVGGSPGALDESLAALAERSSIRGGIGCEFQSTGSPCAVLGLVQESMLRIAQEATNNAMRHSTGSRVRILLNYANQAMQLTVEDDGQGMPEAAGRRQSGGFGMTGMANRAEAIGGALELRRSPLGGLAVDVKVPCPSAGGLPK